LPRLQAEFQQPANNNAWDYAFYVVSDIGAHTSGFRTDVGDALDLAAGSMGLSFSQPSHDTNDSSDFTSALGYSYDADPNFMYCAEDMTTTNGTVNWWLPSCGLTGGSSGGPWGAADDRRQRSDHLGEFVGVHQQPGDGWGKVLSNLCFLRLRERNEYRFRQHSWRRRQCRSGCSLPVG
jgi:hypothetical protein